MKKVFLFLFFLFLFFPGATFAQVSQDWTITNFQSNIAIQNDGKVQVGETIAVDFGNVAKHGIYRDIPDIYQDQSGQQTYLNITTTAVTMDNTPIQYTSYQNGNNYEIKIGDPNRTITGAHSYSITYLVVGTLRSFTDHDELYWNVTGNSWQVPINAASAVVSTPVAITKVTCFEGAYGSTTPCTSLLQSDTAQFTVTQSLAAGEGLTIVVGYQKGVVPILTAMPVQPTTVSQTNSFSISWSTPVFLLALFLSIGLLFFFWIKSGRHFNASPYGSTIVVEYTPPNNLRPAEIGTIIDERADTLDVTATIIDLAARGFLIITEVPKQWIFGAVDYTLTKQNKDTSQLLDYEKTLFIKLFATGDSINVSELKMTFYSDLALVKTKLYDDVVAKNFFPQSPQTVRGKYTAVGSVMLSVGILILFFANAFIPFGTSIGAGLLVSGILFMICSNLMPHRTPVGAEMERRIKGYRLFIDEAEKYRQQYFEKENIFNDILAYAIVFGLTEKFAKALKNMGIEPRQPSWYYGQGTFNAVLFSSNINAFSRSMSSAIASTPSRGGGFGGGGFSGGGFGGGGGGSW